LEWRRAIEPKILHALDVDVDPVTGVFIGIDPSRVWPVGITLAQAFQLSAVNRGQDPAITYRVCPATSVFPQALRCVAGPELFEFIRNPHSEMMQETPLHSRNEA